MGLMLEALRQIEVKTERSFCAPGKDDNELAPHWSDFSGASILWPECLDDDKDRFYAETANSIIRQLSGGEDAAGYFSTQPSVLAFTSAMAGDGKTTAVTGLSPHFARKLGRGVLVTDANRQKPDLSTRLGMPPTDEASARPLLICPTNEPYLSLLPAASFSSVAWLDDLRDAWPLVLLDTASLQSADVTPLLGCCDAVYMIVRLGHTPRRVVRDAAQTLRTSGARFRGCIVVR